MNIVFYSNHLFSTLIIKTVVCGASEEEDPLDPLSDAIFHPKPGGLIPPR